MTIKWRLQNHLMISLAIHTGAIEAEMIPPNFTIVEPRQGMAVLGVEILH